MRADFFQAKAEKIATNLYNKVMGVVNQNRGYECFVFRRSKTGLRGEVSAYGNRGNETFYEAKPYLSGVFTITGLNNFRLKSDRQLDTYNDQKMQLWTGSKVSIERDSIIYVNKGTYDIGKVESHPILNPKKLRHHEKDVYNYADIIALMVVSVETRAGHGEEMIQCATVVPQTFPLHLEKR